MRSVGTRFSLFAVTALVVSVSACDKPTHANIEKWRSTQKGPGKLESALRNGSLDADLRAHAAQVLVALDKEDVVLDGLKKMADEPRAAVIDKLAPRLWSDAKTATEAERPTEKSQLAKDALYAIRDLATVKERDVIDGYLVDWLGGDYYEQRSTLGRHNGELIVRAVGPKAAPKLIGAAKTILKHPEEGDKIVPIGDGLLKGIALTGSPDAVGFLMDLAEKPLHPDETLQVRAMGALYYAYNDFEKPPDARAIVPHLPRLVTMASDDGVDPRNTEVAFFLIEKSGKGACLKPLVGLATNKDPVRMWHAVQSGLRCGGSDAIVAMAEALPQDRKISRGIFQKYFWDKALAVPGAAKAARTLLGSSSWVGRITGVELLSKLGGQKDAAGVRKLGTDSTKLKGWWGEADPTGKKPDPTLGSEALVVADLLEKKR